MYNILKPRNRFLALLLLIGLASCSKSGSNSTTSNTNMATTPSGNWIVSSYTQRSENKTSLFSGYMFTFANSGVFTATNNGVATNGSWSYTAASSGGGYYGGTATNATYTFNMGTKEPLNLLNRAWNVSSANASTISLVNPQPTEGEQITFTKQ